MYLYNHFSVHNLISRRKKEREKGKEKFVHHLRGGSMCVVHDVCVSLSQSISQSVSCDSGIISLCQTNRYNAFAALKMYELIIILYDLLKV